MLSFQVQVSRRGEILFHPAEGLSSRGEILFHPAEGLSSRDEIIFHPAKRNFQKICENTKHIFSNFSSVSYTIKLLGIYFLHGRSGRIRISQPSGDISSLEASPLGVKYPPWAGKFLSFPPAHVEITYLLRDFKLKS